MNKFFLPWIFAMITFSGFTQSSSDTLNRTDEQGLKQGYWIKLDEEGMLKYEGTFKDNNPTGNFIYYYPDGVVRARSSFYDDGKKSVTTTYHHSGKIMNKK